MRRFPRAASGLALVSLLSLASPSHAQGDPEAGAKAFAKCRACHSITATDGTAIVRGGKTGPDLYGVVGRGAGLEFNYSPALRKAHETGLVWSAESLTQFLADPTAFLKTYTGDDGARSKMAFRLTRGAEDIIAYLASLSGPQPD
ncbi:c-type cytochrome [Haematobacter genomosp. 1]|uniref:Cytochrome C n=1 Tax=Haematobacter genomosp. 1 TaxID=366618 RepID=A0A212A823_9RHOB|nr:c-type cytochrome [Haematobacter genomosp. 1]OWJ75868.1 cytochrome C [Haematobacter genomosp. 1]